MHTRVMRAFLASLAFTCAGLAQSVWTGAAFSGNYTDTLNWANGSVPTGGNTTVLSFGGINLNDSVTLPSTLTINRLDWTGSDNFRLKAAGGGTTLTLGPAGITGVSGASGRLRFDSGVTLALVGATTFNLTTSSTQSLALSGQITGTGPLNLAAGTFIFNRTAADNNYTGGTTIGTATSSSSNATVTYFNAAPFGNGPITFQNGANFLSYNNPTLTNALVFNASGSTAPNAVIFRAGDVAQTFSGPVTLAGNTVWQANFMPANFRTDEGFYIVPGAGQRNPIVFTGNISETGGNRTLTVRGPGVIMLGGASSWTGGTSVGQGNGGSLVFTSAQAIPTTGQITINQPGYVGVTDPAFFAGLNINTSTSGGAIGLDTAPGASLPIVMTGNISLASFTNSSIRLGTATKAVIASTSIITPQGANYRFGNGGGTLFVQSALTGTRGVVLSNGNPTGGITVGSPLMLVLQGNNTFTGNVTVDSGQLVLDSALPGTGQTLSMTQGVGYIGLTENAGLAANQFLARFVNASSAGTIGFDTAPLGTSPATTPRVVSDAISMATVNGGFGNSTYLGTTTGVILAGPIEAWGGGYRFTAARGSTLQVSSNLTGAGNGVLVGVNSSFDQPSNGTVVLSGNNTYGAGTLLQGNPGQQGYLTVQAGSANAFGTGNLIVAPGSSIGLQVGANVTSIANPIVFTDNTTGNITAGSLIATGANSYTLSGSISSPASLAADSMNGGTLLLANTNNLTITLAGDNSAWKGLAQVNQGTLALASATAAGSSQIYLTGNNTALQVLSSTLIHGLQADTGSKIGLADGITLTFDANSDNYSTEIKTSLGGLTGGSTTAAVAITGTGNNTQIVFFARDNNYTGGTTISNGGALALGTNAAAGTGTVTLNATDGISPTGGIALAPGVTFTNNLVFTGGILAGRGTFAASNLSTYTFATGQGVMPGFTDIAEIVPGKLTLAGNANFTNGGTFVWGLQDASLGAAGSTTLDISGVLSLTATATPFTFRLQTFDATGNQGAASNFDLNSAYTWTLASASGGISGLSTFNYTIDSTGFANNTALGYFSLLQSGNSLLLNFTPVPEPSTYALCALGLGSVWFIRRRRPD